MIQESSTRNRTDGKIAISLHQDLIHIILAFVITFFLNFIFLRYNILDLDHEGVLLKPAIDITEGKMLFRDSFTQYGPVPILMQAAVISAFGKYVFLIRLQVVILYSITAALLWLIWRKFSPRWVSTSAVVIWNLYSFHFLHTFMAWSSSYALFFQTIALYCLIQSYYFRRFNFLFLAGASACLTFLCKQNVGIYLVGAEISFIVLISCFLGQQKRKIFIDICAIFMGILSVSGPFLVWLAYKFALHDWWLQSIVWPEKWAKIYGGNYDLIILIKCLLTVPILLTSNLVTFDWIFLCLPLTCIIIFLSQISNLLSRRITQKELAVLATLFVSFASWLQYFPVNGLGHLWWSSTPMFGLLTYFLYECSQNLRQRSPGTLSNHGIFLLLPIVALMLPSLIHRLKVALKTFQTPVVQVLGEKSPFKGLFLPKEVAEHFQAVEEAIETTVNRELDPEVIMDGVEGGYLAFVKNAKNFHPFWPTRYFQVIEAIYPDFPTKLETHIHLKKPFIFTTTELSKSIKVKYPGYRVIRNVNNSFVIMKAKNI